MKALIALEDGTIFDARAFAGSGEVHGELVFNTSMTGYQEILTDPSYAGQIVTLTYPLIGNYGVNETDNESYRPHAAGLIVGECSRVVSNWRAEKSLPEYMEENNILGLHHVDCRAITLHIRSKGAMRCVMSTEDLDPASLVEKAKNSPGLVGRDLATEVSIRDAKDWPKAENGRYRIAALDCGVKFNQLNIFKKLDADVRLFPNTVSTEEIQEFAPDGLFISNGPGDPGAVPQVVDNLRKLIHTGLPTFGICFGHQLLGLAMGGSTYKLKFGHRGGNQPVMNLQTGKVEITSQNHGFCVDKDSFNSTDVDVSHINLNDQTCEGLRHTKLPVFSVQYHPEANPGPHDSEYLFQQFLDNIDASKA